MPDSVIVEYRYQGVLAAFNLCFMHNGNFIDKYVAFKYPLARDLNLYFVRRMVNLELARLAACRCILCRCTDVFDTDKKWRDESGLLSTPTL